MIKNICRVIRRYINYARSNNENYAPKNYNYIYIKYILCFSSSIQLSFGRCKNEVCLYLLLLFLAVGWDFCVCDFIFMCEIMIYQLKRKYYSIVQTYVGLISWDHLGAWDQSGPPSSQTLFGQGNIRDCKCGYHV